MPEDMGTVLTGRAEALEAFAREAWAELKAVGRDGVFLYGWLEAQARELGIEVDGDVR